jgi:hypothetical protein
MSVLSTIQVYRGCRATRWTKAQVGGGGGKYAHTSTASVTSNVFLTLVIGSESSLLLRVDKAFSCAQCPLKYCASRGGIRLTRLAGGAGESIGGGGAEKIRIRALNKSCTSGNKMFHAGGSSNVQSGSRANAGLHALVVGSSAHPGHMCLATDTRIVFGMFTLIQMHSRTGKANEDT